MSFLTTVQRWFIHHWDRFMGEVFVDYQPHDPPDQETFQRQFDQHLNQDNPNDKYLEQSVKQLEEVSVDEPTQTGSLPMSDYQKLLAVATKHLQQASDEVVDAKKLIARLSTTLEPIPDEQVSNKTHIVIHHSLTEDSGTVSWGAIRRYHMETNGWRNVGYQYCVEDVSGYQEILIGRFEHESGAHCPQERMNHVGIGICCVGNFDLAPPPQEQWERCLDLCRHITQRLQIPRENVRGHNEFNPGKSCPGKYWDMNKFREAL